ncbi:Zinc finger protein 106 [Chionoecetes opilio]|uniref:Zinc finger protein 106 n=1 Tax=Chionoecetes opilio TaxID=41210 RepID=A0A8J5CIP2_CHIOP|nr:Zinc finger protein 106 [Chionoecetes opilio]
MEPPSPCASRARTPHPPPPTLFASPCASRARTPHPPPPTLFASPCASRARTPHPPPPTLFASPCASRARTPHPPHLPLPTLFAPPLASPRSGISGVEARVSIVEAKVSIGVQTEREVRVPVFLDSSPSSRKLYIPNLNLARSVTPFITTKVDQSTSTDDLPWDPFQPHPSQPLLPVQQQQQQQQRSKSRAKGWWWHRTGRPRNHMAQLAAISNSLSNFEWSSEAGAALQQMAVLGEQEGELLRHADLLDQDVHDLLRERRRVTEELARLQQLRAGKLRQLVQQSGSGQEGAEGPGPRGPTGDSRPNRVSQQDSSSDGGEPMDGANSSVANPAESLSQRYGGAGRGDACVQSTTDNASVVSSSQEKTPRVRSFSFSHTSSNDSSNESQSVRRQRCTSTCHSPGRNQKSRESQQGHLQGSNSHGEEYFQVEGGVAHLILHPSASTDSEAENDTRALRASVDSSEAKAAVSESQNSNRNRMSSLSSSAEGDTESEAPPDPDQDDKIPSLALDMTLDEGEAVVDSSERPDDKLDNDSGHPEDPAETSSGAHQGDPGPSKSQELQQVQKMEIVEDSGTSHKHEETVSTLIVFCTKPEPPDSPQKPVTPPPTSAHPSHPLSYLKSEPQSTPQLTDTEKLKSEEQETVHPPSSVKCEDDMLALNSHLPIASTSQAASDRDTLTNTHKKTCLSSSSPSSSPMSSPESLKSRYTSSEHCYSLRSRGPPRRMRQVPQRPSGDNQEEEKKAIDKQPEEQPGHSRIKEDEEGEDNDSEDGSEDKKRKRKRKAKRHRFNKRKKKKLQEKAGKYSPRAASEDGSKGAASPVQDQDRFSDEAVESSGDEMVFMTPPAHGSAVLDMKVVGGYIMTASSDGTARCYDPATGQVMATYADHADLVTCIGVVGQPGYDAEAPKFLVVTGSADRSVCVFNGQTGEVQQRREVGEVVRCLDISWGQLFLGTEGGCGARWNFKDKGVTEMVQFCGKAVTSMKAMTEGGRRVLLVAAKTTPLMIRDAMTGLFLRTLEHIQMTVYATVSYGGLLYSGGSEKIIVYYDFTSGSSRGHLESEADVSGLTVYRDYLLATCYDGLIRIFCLKTRKLLHRLSIETTNKMFICSALYKDRLLVGNKTGEVVECLIPAELKALPCPP